MHQKQPAFPPAISKNYDDAEGVTRVWALLAVSERDDKYASDYGGGYRHLRFSFVTVPGWHGAGEATGKTMRNELGSPMFHLELTSQGDRYRPDELYAYDLEYRHLHSLDRREVRDYARFLERIWTGLERIDREYGRPTDYKAFVVRVAQVLGVRYLIQRCSTDRTGWDDYAAGDYEVTCLYQRTNKGLIDKLDGKELEHHLYQLVYRLWTESDRAAAKEALERKTAELARKAAEDRSVAESAVAVGEILP